MSEPPLRLDANALFAQIQAEQATRKRLADEAIPANKAALFAALAGAGINTLVVTFDGYGDSGQIESTAAHAGDEAVDLPEVAISIATPRGDGSGLDTRSLPLAEAVEELVYDLHETAQPGWEINEGSYGEFTFAVAERAIRLDMGLRTTEPFADEW